MPIFLLDKISKIYKTHNGDFFALKDISISLPSTGLVSIVGKSGSGKSTLLNILLGIEKPSNGILKFNNKDITKMSDKKFSRYHLKDVSMVFQHYNLFQELSAKENIMIPLLMRGESKSNASKKVDKYLVDFEMNYLSNQKVKLLSGGEKQRVAIIRALITSPKVILCDEPTGALDEENSQNIMQILDKLSKDRLVIHVSHNHKLVEQYSDRIITLKDGQIVDDNEIKKSKEKCINDQTIKYSSKWTRLFRKINLKLNFKKNIFSIISCMVGFTAIFLSFGFYAGSQISQDNALKNNLSVLHASCSEKTFFDIENSPLSYEKSVRPSLESIESNLEEFEHIRFESDLSYFFSPYPYGTYQDRVIETFQMVPLYDISLEESGKELLVSGSCGNGLLEEVIVNEEFVKLLGLNNEEIIDDLFNISNSLFINYSTGDYDEPFIKDEFFYDFDLRIVGVVKEFSFLNTPKIYYSYPAVKKELSNIYLENISSYLHHPTSCLDYIESSEEDDAVSNYATEIFLDSLDETDKFFNKIKQLQDSESSFQIESTAYDIQQSYKTFISSFSTTLFVFVIIAFLGVNFILGMISLSTYIENKKNSAILTCLGARNSSIQSIYLIENYLLIVASLVLSVFISLFAQFILNSVIENSFALANLISIPFISFYNIPLGLILAIGAIAIIFSTIFTLVPMFIYRHISLSDELRDE